jgi:glucuronoarabinoxylan endo-1,4-beta-xylanase
MVSSSVLHQSLTGLGATLAYVEQAVTSHPEKSALFQALFSNLGLDILRLRNRYGYAGDDDLSTAGELVRAATDGLGRSPIVMLASWSPPATLKANGSVLCQGNADTCTLTRLPSGEFDYAGLAAHWRSSLEAYADIGVVPDYIGIQNNPDFVPAAWAPGEGCRLLPTEGSTTEWVDGANVSVDYPGFAEALNTVIDQLAGLSSPPKITAPETSTLASVADYMAELDLSRVDAIAHHLYGTDPSAIDPAAFETVGELGRSAVLPVFQTEMESDGLGTAVLMHHALAVEGASAYLHSILIRPESMSLAGAGAMVTLGDEDFVLEAPYHVVRHFAYYTDPGWYRAEATSDVQELLVSAWMSPDETALTLVLVNTGSTDLETQLDLEEPILRSSTVTRTTFDGIERSAVLGALPPEGLVRLPGHAILTVALHE